MAEDGRYTMHRVIAAYIRKKLPEPTYRDLNRRVADHYLAEMQALEEQYQEGGSTYRAMYRYEDPQWTHCQDNWLYYLARAGNDAEGGLAFLRAWVDAFWWWSCFTEEGFDFCDQLLREWDHRLRLKLAVGDSSAAGAADERAARSNRGLELLRSFKLAYPKEFPRGGGRQNGSWPTVDQTLLELRRLVGIDGDLALLSNVDARHVRAMTNVFLAEAARFGRKDFALAESYYRESLQLLRDSVDTWNVAWLLYHLSDMFASCGRDAELRPLCEEALGLGLDSAHRDYEVIANIAQQVAGRLLEAQSHNAAEALAAAWQMRQTWIERGAELAAVPGRDALLQTGSADLLALCLFPPTLVLERRALDGDAYASRVRGQLGLKWNTPEAASPLPLQGATPAAGPSPIRGVCSGMHDVSASRVAPSAVEQLK